MLSRDAFEDSTDGLSEQRCGRGAVTVGRRRCGMHGRIVPRGLGVEKGQRRALALSVTSMLSSGVVLKLRSAPLELMARAKPAASSGVLKSMTPTTSESPKA